MNKKRDNLIAGNWKMNGSLKQNSSLITDIKRTEGLDKGISELLVCPPDPYLSQARSLLSDVNIHLGAQNVSKEVNSGAFTGEVSAKMLQDLDCSYCIIGHSERRANHNESDDIITEKFFRLLENKITPILCVGESLEAREFGNYDDFVLSQLERVSNKIGIDKFLNTVIAYEPIWAIGTGVSASSEQAQEMHLLLRSFFSDSIIADSIRIIYGGSVKPSNSKELFSMPDIDGALIGGASLNSKDFLNIYKSSF